MSLSDRDYYQEQYQKAQKPRGSWLWIIIGIIIVLGLIFYFITR